MSKPREIPIDASRMTMLVLASLIDASYTDHEILTMCEETLRKLRADLTEGATKTAVVVAIAIAEEWNKKS